MTELTKEQVATATQAMIDAIRSGDGSAFQRALDYGADINAEDGMPLLATVEEKRYDFACELLRRKTNAHLASSNIAAKESKARAAFKYALSASAQEHADDCGKKMNQVVEIQTRLQSYIKGYQDLVQSQQHEMLQEIAENVRDIHRMLKNALEPAAHDKSFVKPGLAK